MKNVTIMRGKVGNLMKRRVWINSILFILTFIFCFSLASCSMDSTVNKLVSKNGVTVEQGDFESGSVLRAVEIKDETIVSAVKKNIALKEYDKTKEIIILDIAVLMNDVRLQPKNKVKISLSKSIDDLNDYVIFHILEDNTVEEITPVVSGGKISFEANSLSYFVIAQKEQKEEVTYKFKALAKTGGKIYHSEILVGEDGFEVLTNEGRNITLTALANPGYEFVGWYGVSVGDYTGIDPISMDLTHTFTVGAEVDGTYAYAVFKAIQKYQFQAVALEGGRITQIGAIIPDTGFECVDYAGTKIPLTAKPNEGYRFLGWYWWNRADYTDIEPISTNPYYEFEVIANPQGAMVFAAFEKVANITLQLDITEGGTVTLDSSPVGESGLTTSIATGKEVLLSATSAEGYTFQGWYEYYESGVYDLRTPLSIGATYSLTIPEKDYHVVAVFRLDITGLIIDGVPGGFASEGVTKVVLGTAESERPNISAVIPYVVTVIGNIRIELSKITISGEIDFTKVGVYTITFSYEDMFIHTPLTATLVVEIVAHSYDLSVQIVNSGFVTMNGVSVPSAGSTIRVREGNTTTLVAQEDIGYTFQGW